MNVALPALIVFVLVLPGFVFRDRFKRSEKTALDYAPFGRVVAEAVMWATLLHVIWLFLAWLMRDQVLRIDLLLGLLSSSTADQAKAIAFIQARSDWFAEYFLTLLPASFLVPTGLRWLITKYRLDREGHSFASWARFDDAPWYYMLSGADFAKTELPDLIIVSAIVDIAGTPYLYRGQVAEFFCASDGQLDRLILENVSRRTLDKDKTTPRTTSQATETDAESEAAIADSAALEQRFYPIDGDYFVLRMSEAVTLNVQYVKLVKLDESQAQASSAAATVDQA
ncbi:hypothetical protein J2789_004318 [Variovorax paradoxus]|uniref:hypothetical protein n=1 Tax=Variovorax atrisoli TaxID=3394203 RepID=UPI00119A4E14|nr:hypothetical protein [Variovorax paradoxus]MDR6521631.1 hypothetical protein [Variovorax paradoxus]